MPTESNHSRKFSETPAGGVYVHVPFCLQKCRYCDFYSVTDPVRINDYVQGLLHEMDLVRSAGIAADTLYLGGGTPSLLDPKDVARIVEKSARCFDLLSHSEITLEVNPGTVSTENLRAFGQAGVNRLNIGIQSFDDGRLAFLGRVHSADQGRKAIEAARGAGFDNIGLDLIYGLPGQSAGDWEKDLSAAVSAAPEHLSCYILTIEPGTPLDRDVRMGRVHPLAEEQVRDLFEITRTRLAAAGYAQYEISNFARSENLRSRHNTKYWNLIPYTGLGPSAHSFCRPDRWWNHKDLDVYLKAVFAGNRPVVESERLTRDQQMIEAIYLGLRQTRGIDVEDFESRFGIGFGDLFAPAITALTAEAMVQLTPDACLLTPAGLIYADAIVGRFVDLVG
ncbi:MAG: radical SAM family heme chaperone HemW [Desulfobacterales bacterium]|nr:radical SAM family heme chaperone HemW [Desulfobacterales bacterium]